MNLERCGNPKRKGKLRIGIKFDRNGRARSFRWRAPALIPAHTTTLPKRLTERKERVAAILSQAKMTMFLVQAVSNDLHGLGFFGLAYYEENKEMLKLVPIDDGKAENGDGPIFSIA